MLKSALIGIVLFLALQPVQQAQASKRLALVIGNNSYQNVSVLDRAINDSNSISRVLNQTGFDVIQANDVNRRTFNQKLSEFVSRIEPGDVALFYYAGHGIEIEGQNYLLPTDIPKANQGQEHFVRSESISLRSILNSINDKKAILNIVILDACRDNPFESQGNRSIGGTRGLASTTAPNGTYILYSAGAGQTALDHLGKNDKNPNSVFTRELIPLIQEPGIEFVDLARQLRNNVKKIANSINHDQKPAYYDEADGKFYFTPITQEKKIQPPLPNKQNTVVYSNNESIFWNDVKNSDDANLIKLYLDQYPNGDFVLLAQEKLKRLASAKPRLKILKPEPPKENSTENTIEKANVQIILNNKDDKSITGGWESQWIIIGAGGANGGGVRAKLTISEEEKTKRNAIFEIIDNGSVYHNQYDIDKAKCKSQFSIIKTGNIYMLDSISGNCNFKQSNFSLDSEELRLKVSINRITRNLKLKKTTQQ